VHSTGRRLRLDFLLAVHAPGTAAKSRVGLAVGKRVGNAVVRNRVKRWIREAVRKEYPLLQGRRDIVFIALPKAAAASAARIDSDVARAFRRIGRPS